jgi:hypothetical protein
MLRDSELIRPFPKKCSVLDVLSVHGPQTPSTVALPPDHFPVRAIDRLSHT